MLVHDSFLLKAVQFEALEIYTFCSETLVNCYRVLVTERTAVSPDYHVQLKAKEKKLKKKRILTKTKAVKSV